MSGEIELWCWVQEDEFDEDHVFQVRIKLTDTVFILMQAIRATGPSLLRIGPEDMQLWKVGELHCCAWVDRSGLSGSSN
jgi:hypothetical protein